MGHQAGADKTKDASDGAQTPNPFDYDIDTTNMAQAAFGYSQENHQVSDMESIKPLLRNFLDDIKEPQSERSSYFNGLLSQWLSIWPTDRAHSLLIYILGDRSEQYGNRMLDIKNLDEIDKTKTRFLEQQSLQQPFCLYLAKMTSTVNIDPDNALDLKMAFNLHEIRNLSGEVQFNKPIAAENESVIQKSILKERYHQQVALQNPYPTPTEGRSPLQIDTAKSFQDWVLVMIPEGYRFKFLTDNTDPEVLHDWIKSQSAGIQQSEMDLTGADPNVRWGLTLACKTQLKNIGTWLDTNPGCDSRGEDLRESIRHSDMLEAVVSASVKLQDADLVQKAVALAPRRLSLAMWEEIGRTMELAHFFSYRNSLNQAILKMNSFQDRYVVLQSIRVGCETQNAPPETPKIIHNWIQDHIEQAMNEIDRVEENDGAILVLVAKKFAKAITMNRIVSFAKKHSSHQSFAIEFAFSLYDELVANTMEAGFAKYALAEILSAAVPAISAQRPHNWSTPPDLQYPASAKASLRELQTAQADRMARLIRCCVTVGLHNEEHALLRHMWLGASMADAPTLQHVYLPYLKQLLIVMRDYHIPLTTQSYQWQFQHVISLFIFRYIGKEPTPLSVDLTCPPLGCASPTKPYGCTTCLELDAFLVDPHLKTAEVTGGIDAPEHVTTQIQGTDYLQMTVLTHSSARMLSTIRITKNITKSEEEPDVRRDLWKGRVVKANDLIQAICGDEEWKMLLGDRYDECMGLEAVKAE